ncbi:MAG: hypothetical protein KIT84_20370 [Labilithrix sp.]|nr:hypothetical protein [Labilithrix sp.]MCW5813395.1 hypothetical protein [Labilithrix sp.]
MSRASTAAAIVVAFTGAACTAIVVGSIGEKSDWPERDGASSSSTTSSSGSSSSSGGEEEDNECSLLLVRKGSPLDKDNRCARCINEYCDDHVELACNREGQAKPWFQTLKNCARNPWDGYPEPDSGGSFSWGCGRYEKVEPLVEGDQQSDNARQRASEHCVHDNCLQGAEPECRLCEVSKTKGTTSERQRLRDDKCGSCFTENCNAVLVECCDLPIMDDYIAACAYTNEKANKRKCGEIGDAGLVDAGDWKPLGSRYGAEDQACAKKLGECFNTHCAAKKECQDE